jgi:hypothetical protein
VPLCVLLRFIVYGRGDGGGKFDTISRRPSDVQAQMRTRYTTTSPLHPAQALAVTPDSLLSNLTLKPYLRHVAMTLNT